MKGGKQMRDACEGGSGMFGSKFLIKRTTSPQILSQINTVAASLPVPNKLSYTLGKKDIHWTIWGEGGS